jgi:NAD(P)-dependent dehydrogenase (short-subunit alcohol dehydrogenase family)
MTVQPGAVVVVTGAGSGIGRAIALAFAARGAKLHLTDLRRERLDEVAASVQKAGGRATLHAVDSRTPADVEALAAAVFAEDGRVDVLCNNAGVGHSGRAHEMPLATWQEIIQTNLMGPVHGVVAFLPRMLAQEGSSHIVNTASIAGLMGLPGMSAYCASKFGVVGMTEALAVELPPDKVRVHAICPGVIRTNIVKDSRLLAMGKVDIEGAVGFYERYGHDPAHVAQDVIAAVEGGQTVRLSKAGPYGFLWRLKRLSGWLYERVARWMGHQAMTRGFPGDTRRG